MSNPMRLLWLDLETTGLDPRVDTILEVSAFGAPFEAPWSIAEKPDFHVVLPLRNWSNVDEAVIDMHAKSGLMHACMKAPSMPISEVDKDMCTIFGLRPTETEKLVLAGSSVHFDLAFLRAHMLLFAQDLSHRVYDVSAVKLFCRSIGMPEPETKPEPAHRATEDVLASIRDARACVDWLQVKSTIGVACACGEHFCPGPR